jgi:hypothetical protein
MPADQREDIYAELETFSKRIEKLENSVGHVEPYVDATALLQSSWAIAGGAYGAPRFYLDPFGRVWLAGRVKGGALASVVFQLPAGYRPPVLVSQATVANDALARVEISAAGNVTFQLGTATTYLDLDPINFKVV